MVKYKPLKCTNSKEKVVLDSRCITLMKVSMSLPKVALDMLWIVIILFTLQLRTLF